MVKFSLSGRTFFTLVLIVSALLTQCFLEQTPLLELRQFLFDYYQRLHPRDREESPVLVVAIDEKSLAQEGQWPWPRGRLAELINIINRQSPIALGLDMVFPESGRFSHRGLQRIYPNISPALMGGFPDSDRQLAQALKSGSVILGVFGSNHAHIPEKPNLASVPVVSKGGDAVEYIGRYSSNLPNLSQFVDVVSGQGLLNAVPDPQRFGKARGVVRRLPLLTFVSQRPMTTLGVEMMRIALGSETPVVAHVDQWPTSGIAKMSVGNYQLHTERQGNFLLHFGPFMDDRYVSAADIFSGDFDVKQFAGRFVLVGFSALGLKDSVLSPLGELIPGVDMHAQMLESLLTETGLRRSGWIGVFEVAVLLGLSLLLVVIIPKLKPRYTSSLGAIILLSLLGGGYFAFWYAHWLFDGLSIAVLLTPLFIVLLRNTMVSIDRRRQLAEKKLQDVQITAARISGELDAARRIQFGLLPDPQQCFTGDKCFEIACLLEPAKEVGGDYYDCFMLDEQQLCLAVGDVSGKGVPASLFMSMSKTLFNMLIRQNKGDLKESLKTLSTELNCTNSESLFVTALAALLDTRKGHLKIASAGHEAPFLIRHGQVEQLNLSDISGPPLCVLDDYIFEVLDVFLEQGDILCMVTDGVTDATDGLAFYGNARLKACLSNLPKKVRAEECKQAIYDDITRFMAGHEIEDDITILVVKWLG